ncbi:MAG: carboxylating nicotinate-nucleotide diphosphorylase [Thermoplasmata archaeon]|jgi:nicotinate-nucleotide pyrophosphorylase (carboxylating)|nr:carboxylating nicotinate-nucleotide diphosphorylase [Thermoplasmata archaeon]
MGPRSRTSRRPRPSYVALARTALAEDRSSHDRTTRAVLRPRVRARALVLAQATGVLSGGTAARAVARAAGLKVRLDVRDGTVVRPGLVVMTLEGDGHRIFAAERSILNVLMHASGIATATARAVRGTRGSRGRLEVWATRKTLPGLRDLEKAAVEDGGGFPHRRDLSDGWLIKTNHLSFVPLETAIARVRRRARRGERVEVEVRTPDEAVRAARAGADALLIDNASPTRARQIVRALERVGLRAGHWVELSGGITPETVGRFRRVGADAVSLGSLTHSAAALPFHLRLEPVRLSRLRP